ncbi:alkylhydroperoxidase/carboxymuconolactone decarboxylase family protein YurZ [Maribacter spongiicola]|uniref:Alkylhydroperoxidase/carboxymuconolactone decarboxylase family protein YurZ n=1 Tax=Maribacter spongiicola TaxID=1206753 RepID=A0A4R7K3V2_9FLAO|nr:alkylhydroperoxidase/carboxymuconolactone decarboxylase family protein YurZ [Maribacter spongiicola]
MKVTSLRPVPIMRLKNILRTANIFVGLVLFISCQSIAQQATSDNALSNQEKCIIKIASHTAQGNLSQLKDVLHEGLDHKLTVNETKEVLVHLYAYAGFPRSIRGLQTLLVVLEERTAKGIEDEWGPEATTIDDSRSKYERGKTILEELVGRPLDGKPEYQKFSPEMDRFLKEHLFADIFERDVLTYKQRELVTISVIASLGSLEPMLRSHLNLSLNVGWQAEQLKEFTETLVITTTEDNVFATKTVLTEVLKRRTE